MKALIWIGCIFCLSLCIVLIKDCGIILGGIPSALMFGVMWWVADKLCKKWDSRKNKDEEKGDEEDDA